MAWLWTMNCGLILRQELGYEHPFRTWVLLAGVYERPMAHIWVIWYIRDVHLQLLRCPFVFWLLETFWITYALKLGVIIASCLQHVGFYGRDRRDTYWWFPAHFECLEHLEVSKLDTWPVVVPQGAPHLPPSFLWHSKSFSLFFKCLSKWKKTYS